MNNVKRYAVIMALGVFMNEFLTIIVSQFNLPVWLDVTGTMMTSFVLEPAAGLLVGLVNNFYLALSTGDSSKLIYFSVSAAVAIITGCIIRKDGHFKLKRVLGAVALIIVISTILSATMTLWRTGIPDTYWENFYYEYFINSGMNNYLSTYLGVFVVKFFDTIASVGVVAIVYLLLPKSLKFNLEDKQ